MGKYVLIEFLDDTAAERLCAQINAAEARGRPFRLAGVFAKPPKKRCECEGVTQTTFQKGSRKDHVVKRHGKTGFWYCSRCKRVRKGWQSPRNQLDAGIIPTNSFSKGIHHEATITLTGDGNDLLNNFPLTTRTTTYDEPISGKTEKK